MHMVLQIFHSIRLSRSISGDLGEVLESLLCACCHSGLSFLLSLDESWRTDCTLLSRTILDIVFVSPLPLKIGCTGWQHTVPARVALARRNNTVQSNGNIVLCKWSMRVDPCH